jgi:hypothetical protein
VERLRFACASHKARPRRSCRPATSNRLPRGAWRTCAWPPRLHALRFSGDDVDRPVGLGEWDTEDNSIKMYNALDHHGPPSLMARLREFVPRSVRTTASPCVGIRIITNPERRFTLASCCAVARLEAQPLSERRVTAIVNTSDMLSVSSRTQGDHGRLQHILHLGCNQRILLT